MSTLFERIVMNTPANNSIDLWEEGLPTQAIPPQRESSCDEAPAPGSSTSGKTNSAVPELESTITEMIERLWSIEQNAKFSLKRTRHERANNRAELAKRLSELKALLRGRGRDGAWLPFLRRLGIPRSTAEGLIKSHLVVDAKDKTTRVPPVMTRDSIPKLLKALKPKLRLLNTRELADHFVRELVVLLDEQITQRNGLDTGSDQPQGQEESSQVRRHEQMISLEAISD